MEDRNLRNYIFGLLTGLLFIPVIEEFINVIQTWIQVLILKPTKIVVSGNKEISELQDDQGYQQTSCIGFQVPSEEEYCEEEE